MKAGTVALVVLAAPEDAPTTSATFVLVETLSDESEIGALETALESGERDPLALVYEIRERRMKEEEVFGDYVEDLLSHPFLPKEVQEHGVQWFKSKHRIEKFQTAETEARSVIAEFAFKVFSQDPSKMDFILASPTAEVRVRVFVMSPVNAQRLAA